jgi:hypothetical protein
MEARFQMFSQDLPIICESFRLDPDELEFNDLAFVVEEWLQLNSW